MRSSCASRSAGETPIGRLRRCARWCSPRAARATASRILIELDQKFPLSPTSQYHLVTNLPKIGFTSERIALVHRTPYAQNANHFINLLGKNHGVMVRNFTGLEPAKAWLRGDSA